MNYQEVETTVCRLQSLISKKYVFPEVAEEICEHIATKLESQIYKSVTTSEELANILTVDMQSINRDKHLTIQVNENLVKEINLSVRSERFQDEPERPNAGFEEISIIDGNVGYLKLTEFADTKYAGDIAVDAMQQLVGCDSVIFDLRENGGGSPKMVQLLTTYLFDHEPVHLNDFYMRETKSLDQFWVLPYVPGTRLDAADVYILTSKETFSAAEEFCYNLQNLKRGKVIGEVTGGGAHPGDVHALNEELVVFIPHGRAINPISGDNWEGIGIQPDILVKADEAFKTALNLAKPHR